MYFHVDSWAGKSYVMAAMAKSSLAKGKNVLILAHRNSLLRQHRELFEELEIENKNLRIESVFTEVRHLGEYGKVDFIIIDERTFGFCKQLYQDL